MVKSRTLPAVLAALALILSAGLAVTFASGAAPARAEQTKMANSLAPRMRVIDGDTLEDMNDDITYRLVNIDTPETGSRARCDAERALGDRATEAARTLVAHARRLEFRPTGRIDRYGRTIAFVLIDGRDMGETLIGEGLARPWRGRREPWCDAYGNLIP